MRGAERDEQFAAFVAARQGHLRRVAFALCGDWHRAEDLLQTALVKLYVAWPRIRRDGGEEAYARQVIVRTSIDEHRRTLRRPERPGLDDLDAPAPSGTDVVERTALVEALQQLPEMQRKVVVLRHWIGLSVAETARELRIGEGTVKSHAHRGLAHLRDTVGERG